jgi:hypothetical protein
MVRDLLDYAHSLIEHSRVIAGSHIRPRIRTTG